MKLAPLAVVLFLFCGMCSAGSFSGSFATMLHRMRCKNHWDCRRCYEVKRQNRCHRGFRMGVCYKTCTGCDSYIDKPGYNCSSIYEKGMCFQKTKKNRYITYAQLCEASCCQAYPITAAPTTRSMTPAAAKPTRPSRPRIIWNQWSPWSLCSTTCSTGFQKRVRNCSFSREPRVNCSRPQSQYRYCNKGVSCGVAGGFSEWSQWGLCSHSCGGGTKTRTRTCTNPPPQNGGRDCQGPSSETEDCNRNCCPEAGEWSPWSAWSTCSKTCCSSKKDGGIRTRTRSCTNPRPYCGGPDCVGPSKQTGTCYPKVHCANPTTSPSPYWSSWGPWGPCSATCYVGYRERQRYCIGYQGYEYCDGRSSQFESCNTHILCY